MASLIVSSRLGRGPARHRSTWSRRCKKPASIVTATAPTCPRVVRHCQELATHRAIIAASRRRGLSSRALVLRRDVNRRCSWRRQCTSSKKPEVAPVSTQYWASAWLGWGGGAVENGPKAARSNDANVPTSSWHCFASRRLLLRSRLPRPNPNAMPVNKIGGSSIWIHRRQAARLRDLRSGGCKDWRQMFHERGAEAAGSHEETRRI